MVKDKVIQMENGKDYYVLEEIDYQGHKYVLSLECDLDKDTVNEEDYFVMELAIEEGNLSIKQIEDDELAKVVIAELLKKIRNS